MTLQRNHYEVLGVPSTATTDQIKKKYRELARKFHPDVVKDKALGQKIFTQVNQAYRILADPERRAQYDAALRADRAATNGSTIAAGGAGPARSNGARAAGNGAANGAAAPTGPLTAQQAQAVSRLISDADFALMNGDAEAAQAHCEAALKTDPRNARALGLLGDALTVLGKRDEAAVAYRRSLEVTPSPMIQAKLSRLESGGLGTRTNPSSGSAPTSRTAPPGGSPRAGQSNGNAPRPQATVGAGDKSAGGLFGRLLGKKK